MRILKHDFDPITQCFKLRLGKQNALASADSNHTLTFITRVKEYVLGHDGDVRGWGDGMVV